MRLSNWLGISTVLAVCLLQVPLASAAVSVGQVDDFESGTTQDWLVGLLGNSHPAPPSNVPDGGPLGAGDNFLQLTAVGGAAAGSRLTVINLAQWAGDYTTAGVGAISMDLKNFGVTDLSIRLYLENPMGGPPTDEAVTTSVLLPSGGGWTHAKFLVDRNSLTTLNGDVDTLLGNVTALRIFHGPAAAFPGPTVVASLGIDNVAALPVPEPATFALLGIGLAVLVVRKRMRAT